jgi:tol-pal system protein YbgF
MTMPWRNALPALAVLTLVLSAPLARAGLFDDDEARKAILDLRAKQTQTEEALRAQASQLAQLSDLIQQLQRSLLDLNAQNEQLRADIAKLRGQDEQFLRDLAEIQRRQRDIAQGVDERIRKIEPQLVTIDGREFSVEPEERRAYEDAMASLRTGDFDKAAVALLSFQRRYPASGYIDSSRYWLANAQYGRRDYKEAINAFRLFLSDAPEHPRAAEAWLAVANCQAETKDTRAAKKTLEELIKQFPKSEAAQAAKDRLASLK